MEIADPLAFDRDVARAAGAWRRWRRRLRQAQGLDDDPFAATRGVTTLSAFRALGALELAGDPLAPALRRWVYRLAEQRINQAAIVAWHRAYHTEPVVVDEPWHAQLTRRALLAQALSEPAQRASWLRVYLDHAEPLGERAGILWNRRLEVASRMGLAHPDALECPCQEIYALAESWLARTADMSAEFFSHELAVLVDRSLGRDVSGSWPPLSSHTLFNFFSETRLLDNLEIDLGVLPPALGASSFWRALARLGAGFSDGAAPTHQPFAIAYDPYGLRRFTHGALFGMLLDNVVFVRRRLRLGASDWRSYRRVLGRVLLLGSRTSALRVLLRRPALDGPVSLKRAFEATVERCLGVSVPERCAGAIFRLHVDDLQRFAALALAASYEQRLVASHDEDWFRNPRAAEQLRDEAQLSPEIGAQRVELEAGLQLLATKLGEAIAA